MTDQPSGDVFEGTRVVPFDIVRLVELQEAGWSYIRP